MRKLDTLGMALVAWGVSGAVIVACGDDTTLPADTTTTGMLTTGIAESSSDAVEDDSTGMVKLDSNNPNDTDDVPICVTDGTCDLIDLLFVIDNSGTMGEEQLNLARNFQELVDALQTLQDRNGVMVNPNVNIMVTTTDFGHPLCTAFQKADYIPRKGAPVYQGCNARINRFSGLDPDDPVIITEACTENCPADVAPGDHFINFHLNGSNVPNNDVGAALSCIGPQGIDGCGYEAPLETMLQAINEGACWNDPEQPYCDEQPEWADTERGFLRDDAILAVALITDEMDCSVSAPGGYSFFTDVNNPLYWNPNPEVVDEFGDPVPQATSAICFNAGVSCIDENNDGIYENCASQNNDALHPVSRYIDYFEYLTQQRNKEVVMLGVLGVPEVVAHNPEPPFEPIAGGAVDLVHRTWIDFPYPAGDILPDEWEAGRRAENKIFEFGDIGPGCTGTDQVGDFTGQAVPPVRIREVCESLNYTDDKGVENVRCCIESICDEDFSAAIDCLTGIVSESLDVEG